MILADKIIEERKRLGLSQEELAEKLDVSRQAVSKWESAQSVPDINRIIQMADLFNVSTDYLLKDDAVREGSITVAVTSEQSDSNRNLKRVSLEEASEFIRLRKQAAPAIANGVTLCIWSSMTLIILGGLSESKILNISENVAGGIGMSVLMCLIAIAVYIFVKNGTKLKKYEYLEKVEIETAYGVDGMAKDKRAAYEGIFSRFVTIGVALCVLSSLPLIIVSFMTEDEGILSVMVGVILLMVGIAVNMFVRVGTVKNSYDMLLQEGDYTVEAKKLSPLLGRIASIYWLCAVAIYLAISLPTGKWDITWVVWPVAGVLFAVVINVVKMIKKVED